MKIIEVQEIPINPKKNTLYSIKSKGVTSYTHGIHKYPAKFIPHIPRWAILKYTKEKDYVLDPFMGCGTTLLEAKILGRNAYGLEISELAKLITKVKITSLSHKKLMELNKELIKEINNIKIKNTIIIPNNIDRWFRKRSIRELAIIKNAISKVKSPKYRKFYFVIFSSIIRKISKAESQSQKVYISSRYPKKYINAIDVFSKELKKGTLALSEFTEEIKNKSTKANIINKDAKKINLSNNSIDLAITSPPYINAINYINIHKLEYAWLSLNDSKKIKKADKAQFGTEKIYYPEYLNKLNSEFPKINKLINDLYKKSKKHSYIVSKYFLDMEESFKEIHRVLKKNSTYCMAIGNNKIKGIEIPNYKILIEIANNVGFEFDNIFSYVIKNRILRIPRNGRGGDINIDNIIVFKKK